MQKVYTKIESIVGNVVTVKAEGVRLGDLALVGDRVSSKSNTTFSTFSLTKSLSAPSQI